METGRNQDPGSLSPDFEAMLMELDEAYKALQVGEMFPSCDKARMFYFMSHRPAGSTDMESPDYYPNHYTFFVAGSKASEEREQNKVFILFMDETTGKYFRVVNVSELRAHYEQELDLSGDEVFKHPELMQDFWQTVEIQGDLGTAVPNQEDMEDFEDIAKSWNSYYKETKSKD